MAAIKFPFHLINSAAVFRQIHVVSHQKIQVGMLPIMNAIFEMCQNFIRTHQNGQTQYNTYDEERDMAENGIISLAE